MEVTQSQQEEVPPLEVTRGWVEPMFGRLLLGNEGSHWRRSGEDFRAAARRELKGSFGPRLAVWNQLESSPHRVAADFFQA